MNTDTQNLFMALYEEHKQRTGHDVYNYNKFRPPWLHCNVCLNLDNLKKSQEKAEAEHYEELRQEGIENKP